MSMSVVYTTINGMLFHENRGGVETEYMPDTLGSCIATKSSSSTIFSTSTYWPYGELRTSTGTRTCPWGFVGLLGYVTDLAKRLYVRARHLRVDFGRWLTVDPLEPLQYESKYGYALNSPNIFTDSSGLSPCSVDCSGECDKHIRMNPSWCGPLPSPPYPPGSKPWAFAFCCNGKPHTCYCPGVPPSPNPYIRACADVHERGHIPPGACKSGFTGPPPKWNDECTALKAGIKCAKTQCQRKLTSDCLDLKRWRCEECRRLKYACKPMPPETWLRQFCDGCGV